MTIRNHFAAIVGSLRDARVVWVDALQHWMVFDPMEFRYKHDKGLAERVVTDYVMREFPDKLPLDALKSSNDRATVSSVFA